jgi:hemerythrin-like domain-containing protein
MQATEILMAEHRVIERVLLALEQVAARVERGDPVDPAFFGDAVTFIREFADGCHHRKEEGVLFPAMHDAGLPWDSGPLAVMLDEHERGRSHTRGMHDAAALLSDGDHAARDTLVGHMRAFVALLREHIAKEDQVLFPMAAARLPAENQSAVSHEVARLQADEGSFDAFARLAEDLVERANA